MNTCQNCKQETANPKFCSRRCSVSYNNSRRVLSDNTKVKISRSVKAQWSGRSKRCTINCKKCGNGFEVKPYQIGKRKYCSKKCSSSCNEWIAKCVESGKRSSRVRRSKNEVLFAEMCKSHFNDVETNKPIFNGWDADIIVHDCKVAVSWNGKWHYEKITESHSVKQVQNRDKIKRKEIEKYGYTPYVIKDMGKFDPEFVSSEFDKFANWCKSNTSLS